MGRGLRAGVVALACGIAAALAVTGLPALAADQSVTAQSDNTWNPSTITIAAGDTVTFTNGGGYHNVCVAKEGQSDCSASNNEFRNGDPNVTWATYTNSHTFTTPGTYKFICEQHASLGMVGTITVTSGGGTTTSTTTVGTTPTQTQTTPTQTQTTPSHTETQTTPADATAPSFTGGLARRASRKALILNVGSSEAATLSVTVFRRPPRAHSFTRAGQASLAVRAGRNVVTIPRRAGGKLRAGAYRLRLMLTDAAGNASAPRTLSFKVA
jgi:plastocyanin